MALSKQIAVGIVLPVSLIVVLLAGGVYFSFWRENSAIKTKLANTTAETEAKTKANNEALLANIPITASYPATGGGGEVQAMYQLEAEDEYNQRRQGSMPTWSALKTTFTNAVRGQGSLYYGEAAIIKEKVVTAQGVTFIAAVVVAANDGQYYLEHHSFHNNLRLRYWSPLPLPKDLPSLPLPDRAKDPQHVAWAEKVIDGTETTDPATLASREALRGLISATAATWSQDK